MPRKKGTVKKIGKTGKYTYYVTIPKRDIDDLGWRNRQRVVVDRVGKKLVVSDCK